MWTKQAPQFNKEIINLGTPVKVIVDCIHTGVSKFNGIVTSFHPLYIEVTYFSERKNKADTCTIYVDGIEEGKIEMIPLVPLHEPKIVKK